MPPDWGFLLDRGVNFRTKRLLIDGGFQRVYHQHHQTLANMRLIIMPGGQIQRAP